MIKGLIPYNTTVPNCARLTQPTIPTIIEPLDGSTVEQSNGFSISWSPALALEGGGKISHYEFMINDIIYQTSNPDCVVHEVKLPLSDGDISFFPFQWRVRAVNTLGNAGGWSLPQKFNVRNN